MKVVANSQKLRGGYYTPPAIARFLAKWAVQRPTDSVLEPSCGDGAILEAIAERLSGLGRTMTTKGAKLLGVELDELEASKARSRLNGRLAPAEVIADDFFHVCERALLQEGLFESASPRFDAVVGNPPFIRYQSFPEESRKLAFRLMGRAGLSPNKLTNAWVAFLVCSALTLNSSGRLAMVIPAELLQVSYAAEIRRFLSDYFARVTIIAFRGLVFPDIQQEVVLLLGERHADESVGIRTVELRSAEELDEFDFFESLNGVVKPLDHTTEKWTKYFLPIDQILLLRQLRNHKNVLRVGSVASVDVGVVTGDNDYFLLSQEEAKERKIARFTIPIVSRSAHLAGLEFTPSDYSDLASQGARVRLFTPRNVPAAEQPEVVQDYLAEGEGRGVNDGYKCRIRRNWFAVPSVWTPDAFALRQVHKYPKLIVNRTEASVTDTVHRVRFKNPKSGKHIAAAFLNSMTLAFAEITGRSYGGGVLTFEPSEVEALSISLTNSENLDHTGIDAWLREGKIAAVLSHTNEVLLHKGLGLSKREVALLTEVWDRLRNRRLERRNAQPRTGLEQANNHLNRLSVPNAEPDGLEAT